MRSLRQKYWNSTNPDASRQFCNEKRLEWEESGAVIPRDFVSELVAEGVLPDGVESTTEPQPPRIVGLLVDKDSGQGFVNPISAEKDTRWSRSPTLPFHPSEIQSLLARLLHAAKQGIDSAVPEAFAFRFCEKLNLDSTGQSMHVAAILAVLDSLAPVRTALFESVCAVVQPGLEFALQPVDGIAAKLEGFKREYGRGSLLIRSPSCSESAKFDGNFETVWPVDSLNELCDRLDKAGALRPLLQSTPLTVAHTHIVLDRLRCLIDEENDNAAALDLCRRITKCGLADGVPIRLNARLCGAFEDVHRHTGEFSEALVLSQEAKKKLANLGDASCYEDELSANVREAAAFFDLHDFNGIIESLTPWCDKCIRDPRLISADGRVRLFNTLARTQAVLGHDGWAKLFEQSIALQNAVDQHSLTRTRNYLTHALLRSGDLERAEHQLKQVEANPNADAATLAFAKFHRAELARRRNQSWPESLQDITPTMGFHAEAFYVQSCARQRGRSIADTVALLHKAEELLAALNAKDDPKSLIAFLTECLVVMRAAYECDASGWRVAVTKIKTFFDATRGKSMEHHYAPAYSLLNDTPSIENAERLLNRVPYL